MNLLSHGKFLPVTLPPFERSQTILAFTVFLVLTFSEISTISLYDPHTQKRTLYTKWSIKLSRGIMMPEEVSMVSIHLRPHQSIWPSLMRSLNSSPRNNDRAKEGKSRETNREKAMSLKDK